MPKMLFDADDIVIPWVESRLFNEHFNRETSKTIGIVDDGSNLIAGVVYSNFCGHDVHMSIAAASKEWATKSTLKTLFMYPFDQLDCVRVTALTARRNRRARSLVERLGFRLEGVQRRGFDGKQDAIAYGMLKTECRWRM